MAHECSAFLHLCLGTLALSWPRIATVACDRTHVIAHVACHSTHVIAHCSQASCSCVAMSCLYSLAPLAISCNVGSMSCNMSPCQVHVIKVRLLSLAPLASSSLLFSLPPPSLSFLSFPSPLSSSFPSLLSLPPGSHPHECSGNYPVWVPGIFLVCVQR